MKFSIKIFIIFLLIVASPLLCDFGDSDNENPVAILNLPERALLGEIIEINAGLSNDPDGLILYYIFEIDRTKPAIITKFPILYHKFQNEGKHFVKLTVLDNSNFSDTTESEIIVINPENYLKQE